MEEVVFKFAIFTLSLGGRTHTEANLGGDAEVMSNNGVRGLDLFPSEREEG